MTGITYLSKRAQSRQNAPPNPRRVLPLGRRKNLNPHILHRQLLHLVQQSVSEPLRQCAAARQHDVAEERFAQIEIGSVDGVDDDLVDTWVFESDNLGIEEDFRGAETLCANLLLLARRRGLVAGWDADLEFVAVRQDIFHHLPFRQLPSRPLLLFPFRIRSYITDFLLHHPDDLLLGTGVEDIA